ncbi:MAG: hypothetical protein M3417_02805 [Actinomycetota bacterium]|nr:hypothetical protein [Actinomycetota bacterium]
MFTQRVVPGVHRGEDASVNWYLLQDGDRLTLVDAGVPASWKTPDAEQSRRGRCRVPRVAREHPLLKIDHAAP